MTDSFEELTAGLTAEQKTNFFRTLHEAGISTKDHELALFFRGLQLYKAYYEEIPVSVQKGVAEKKKEDSAKDNNKTARVFLFIYHSFVSLFNYGSQSVVSLIDQLYSLNLLSLIN
jgi:hypothetical protein